MQRHTMYFYVKEKNENYIYFFGGIIADSWDYEQDAGDSEDSENGFGIPKVNENNEKHENFEHDLFSYILIISRVFGIKKQCVSEYKRYTLHSLAIFLTKNVILIYHSYCFMFFLY